MYEDGRSAKLKKELSACLKLVRNGEEMSCLKMASLSPGLCLTAVIDLKIPS